MLKKIALTGLFALAAAFATAGTVSAKTGTGKARSATPAKTVVSPIVPQGLCPVGC